MEFLIGLLFIIIIIYFLKSNRKRKNNSKDIKKNIVSQLTDLEREIENFKEEKEMKQLELNKLSEKLNSLIDKAIEGSISNEELEEITITIKGQVEKIKIFTKEQFRRREQVKRNVQKEVGSFKSFLDKNSVYPKDYLFSANKLQGFLVDLDYEKGQSLVKKLNEIESDLASFQKEMKKFITIHTQVTSWINKSPEVFANDKQELFFFLNNGELEKAETLFNQILNDKNSSPEREMHK